MRFQSDVDADPITEECCYQACALYGHGGYWGKGETPDKARKQLILTMARHGLSADERAKSLETAVVTDLRTGEEVEPA